MARKIVFAAFSAHISPAVMINEGEPWDAADPIVTAHPTYFTDEPPGVRTSTPAVPGGSVPWGPPEYDTIEAASAVPGERRDLPLRAGNATPVQPATGGRRPSA